MTGKRKVRMPKLMNLSKLRRRVEIIKIKKAGIYERWGKKVYAGRGPVIAGAQRSTRLRAERFLLVPTASHRHRELIVSPP